MTPLEEQILYSLGTIEGNNNFATTGTNDFTHPGLHIEGVGDVGLPLNEIQAKALIEVARQAPFGRGSQTVTDTKVRKSWEIDASQVSFKNKAWNKAFKKIMGQVQEGLGIENRKVSHSLYKLLIYEEGGFFLPHKDSEKEKGMFATLVVGLPSTHTGGELLVRFGGVETVADFAPAASSFQMPHVAFYADCEHEIKPVTSGYRMCLVYNLLQHPNEEALNVLEFDEQIDDLIYLLTDWAKTEITYPKAILLEHEYTPTNFSLAGLKQHDQPRAEVLLAAAEKAGYMAHLGLLEHHISGELESDYDYYRRSRRRRSYYYDDDDEPEGEGTMGEVYETMTRINHWADDDSPGLGGLSIDAEKDVLSEMEVGEGEPSKQEQEGYTGNAGMTLDYWYYYGAVILWHKSQHFFLLQSRPISVRLKWLQYYLKNWKDTQLAAPEMARKIIAHFTKEDTNPDSYYGIGEDFSIVGDVLVKLQDKDFVQNTALDSLTTIFENIKALQWGNLLQAYSSEVFEPIFQKAGKSKELSTLAHLLDVLQILTSKSNASLAPFLMKQIDQIPYFLNTVELYNLDGNRSYDSRHRPESIEKIVSFVLNLSSLKEEDEAWRIQVLDCLTEKMPRKYVNEILIPSLKSSKSSKTQLFKGLYYACIIDLQNRVDAKPYPPSNWTRPIPQTDSDKDVWKMLTPFLKSPTQQVFDYTKNQSYRDSLSSVIRYAEVDLKMETITRGRPYTLRLTKTQSSYEKQLKEWKEDVTFLGWMKKNG